MVSPWLLCRVVWTLKDSLMTGVLEDWGDYTSADVARVMPYADLGFSGCALLVTSIIIYKRWTSKAALRRYAAAVKNTLQEIQLSLRRPIVLRAT